MQERPDVESREPVVSSPSGSRSAPLMPQNQICLSGQHPNGVFRAATQPSSGNGENHSMDCESGAITSVLRKFSKLKLHTDADTDTDAEEDECASMVKQQLTNLGSQAKTKVSAMDTPSNSGRKGID